jgi:hypothetical protein
MNVKETVLAVLRAADGAEIRTTVERGRHDVIMPLRQKVGAFVSYAVNFDPVCSSVPTRRYVYAYEAVAAGIRIAVYDEDVAERTKVLTIQPPEMEARIQQAGRDGYDRGLAAGRAIAEVQAHAAGRAEGIKSIQAHLRAALGRALTPS